MSASTCTSIFYIVLVLPINGVAMQFNVRLYSKPMVTELRAADFSLLRYALMFCVTRVNQPTVIGFIYSEPLALFKRSGFLFRETHFLI